MYFTEQPRRTTFKKRLTNHPYECNKQSQRKPAICCKAGRESHSSYQKIDAKKNNQPENKQQSIRKWHKRTVSWGPAKNRSLTYTEIS